MQVYILQFSVYILLFFSLNFKIKLRFLIVLMLFWKQHALFLQWNLKDPLFQQKLIDLILRQTPERLIRACTDHRQTAFWWPEVCLESFIPHCMETSLFVEERVDADQAWFLCWTLLCVFVQHAVSAWISQFSDSSCSSSQRYIDPRSASVIWMWMFPQPGFTQLLTGHMTFRIVFCSFFIIGCLYLYVQGLSICFLVIFESIICYFYHLK